MEDLLTFSGIEKENEMKKYVVLKNLQINGFYKHINKALNTDFDTAFDVYIKALDDRNFFKLTLKNDYALRVICNDHCKDACSDYCQGYTRCPMRLDGLEDILEYKLRD